MTYICSARRYEYRGTIIEIPGIGGPCVVKPNGDIYQRLTKKQEDILLEFCGLSDEEVDKCRIGGGCEAHE